MTSSTRQLSKKLEEKVFIFCFKVVHVFCCGFFGFFFGGGGSLNGFQCREQIDRMGQRGWSTTKKFLLHLKFEIFKIL